MLLQNFNLFLLKWIGSKVTAYINAIASRSIPYNRFSKLLTLFSLQYPNVAAYTSINFISTVFLYYLDLRLQYLAS